MIQYRTFSDFVQSIDGIDKEFGRLVSSDFFDLNQLIDRYPISIESVRMPRRNGAENTTNYYLLSPCIPLMLTIQ